jgi:hypothetical protein
VECTVRVVSEYTFRATRAAATGPASAWASGRLGKITHTEAAFP